MELEDLVKDGRTLRISVTLSGDAAVALSRLHELAGKATFAETVEAALKAYGVTFEDGIARVE